MTIEQIGMLILIALLIHLTFVIKIWGTLRMIVGISFVDEDNGGWTE